MITGKIFDIQRFCVEDGPGIRTTVFLKGCSLRCKWCSNPESQESYEEYYWNDGNCIGCLSCMKVCPVGAIELLSNRIKINRTKCNNCGECLNVCPSKAINCYGRDMTVEETLNIIHKDRDFYENSGGGVTLSGGEPLNQFEFALDLFKRCKESGYHTAIETTGNVPMERLKSILSFCDLFLYDCKCIDEHKHIQGTGVSNKRILSNLVELSKMKANIIIRIPIIPDFNDDEKNILDTISFINALGKFKRVDILSFHRLGNHKYEKLDKNNIFKNVLPQSEDEIKRIVRMFRDNGIDAIANI